MDPFYEDETVDFWLSKSHEKLASVAAATHKDRRMLALGTGLVEVVTARKIVAAIFLKGHGVEVGAGDRPWPVPDAAHCFFGDIRNKGSLSELFGNDSVVFDRYIDAQTFEGVADETFDFVVSGHVLEHLADPVGSIRETLRVVKNGGIFLCAVPDMRHTFDHGRPETTLEHLLGDERDGGRGTTRQAYEEHIRYVHPLSQPEIPGPEIARHVETIMAAAMDIHFHAWTGETFLRLLHILQARFDFRVLAELAVQNEHIFVLRKTSAIFV